MVKYIISTANTELFYDQHEPAKIFCQFKFLERLGANTLLHTTTTNGDDKQASM